MLQGAWITLPMPAERLQDTLKTEVGLGGRYEEYAIHDYEGGEGLLATVANPGEYESLTDLNLMCRAFEAREDDDPDVYEKVQTVRDDLDAAPRTPLQYANLALNSDEIPYHSYDAPSSAESKEAKYAWTAVNHGWASDAVWSMFDTGLGYLIDMEMYGRDLTLDGDVSLGDNGYLEDADWPSDIDGRYSREEIAEEVEWLDDFDAKTGSPAAFDLASLVQPGERIADYTISGTGTNWGAPSYQCIVEEGSTDIHAALEDTMHRIIDARAATGDAVDVLRETMGAVPAASVGEDDGVSPIDLDLGYVLPGAVTSFAERAQACDCSRPGIPPSPTCNPSCAGTRAISCWGTRFWSLPSMPRNWSSASTWRIPTRTAASTPIRARTCGSRRPRSRFPMNALICLPTTRSGSGSRTC